MKGPVERIPRPWIVRPPVAHEPLLEHYRHEIVEFHCFRARKRHLGESWYDFGYESGELDYCYVQNQNELVGLVSRCLAKILLGTPCWSSWWVSQHKSEGARVSEIVGLGINVR